MSAIVLGIALRSASPCMMPSSVVPNVREGVIHCPCHEGFFDLKTGRVLAGPPPRPLTRILLEIRGDDVYATGVEWRTV